jgi:hypothetical protein
MPSIRTEERNKLNSFREFFKTISMIDGICIFPTKELFAEGTCVREEDECLFGL